MGHASSASGRIVGRAHELARLRAIIRRGGSCLLTGPAGIGKTALLDEVARGIGSVIRVSAGDDAWEPAGEPAALAVVDDLERADAAIIGWLDGLVRGERLSVIGAARTPAKLHPGLSALLRDGHLEQVDVEPLDVDAIALLGAHTLGAPLAEPLVRDLASRWDGSPLTLSELLLAASELGAVELRDDRWHAVGALPTYRLGELITLRLSRLSASTAAAAELLASFGPLPLRLAVGAVASDDLAALDAAGLLRWSDAAPPDGGTERQVGLAHPLHAEALAAIVGDDRRRHLAKRLVELAGAWTPSTTRQRLRLASWLVEAGEGDHRVLTEASRDAYTQLRFGLSARLGLAALERGGGYYARLAAGAALAETGETARARLLLEEAGTVATQPLERAWAAIAAAHVIGVLEGRWTESDEVLRAAHAGTEDVIARADIAAYRALLAAIAGDLHLLATARADHDEAVASPRARLLVSVADGVAGGLRMDATAAHEAVERAGDVSDEAQRSLPIGVDLLRANQLLAAARRVGPVPAVVRAADEQLQGSLRALSVERSGLWATVVGQLLERTGAIGPARDQLADAVWRLERGDSVRLRPVAVTSLALAQVQAGDTFAAARTLGQVADEHRAWRRVGLRRSYLEAWLLHSGEGSRTAALAAVDAGDRAHGVGHLATALDCWHLPARLGVPDAGAAQRLERLAAETGAPVARSLADHAAALLEQDAGALERVARGLAAVGLRLLAAEAATQAVELTGREHAVARFAAALAVTCPAAATPYLPRWHMEALTPREREVGAAAAAHGSTGAIADHLTLSPRTVDNHLGALYRKVGVSGREELVAAFAGTAVLAPDRT